MRDGIGGLLVVLAILVVATPSATVSAETAAPESDEVVVFYPSFLTWNAGHGTWQGEIRGTIFERERGAASRARLAALRKALKVATDRPVEDESIFRARTEEFAVDHERGEKLVVELGELAFPSRPSRKNGHFRVPVTLPGNPKSGTLRFRTRVGRESRREFDGTVTLIEPRGLSVISDIDDTIKKSEVLDRAELLANTFFRPYEAIPDMPELYRAWGDRGVAIHYVTASPWQLFMPLWRFLGEKGFPGVDIRMRHLRLTDVSVFEFFRDSRAFKRDRIRNILRSFPERRFVLVGDSGEHDPEVYAGIAREFPDQVQGILIRAVDEDHLHRSRYREVFREVDESRWIVFDRAATLPRDLAGWLRSRSEAD